MSEQAPNCQEAIQKLGPGRSLSACSHKVQSSSQWSGCIRSFFAGRPIALSCRLEAWLQRLAPRYSMVPPQFRRMLGRALFYGYLATSSRKDEPGSRTGYHRGKLAWVGAWLRFDFRIFLLDGAIMEVSAYVQTGK